MNQRRCRSRADQPPAVCRSSQQARSRREDRTSPKPPARNLVLAQGREERAGDWLFRTRRGIRPAFITAFDTMLGFLGATRRRVAVVVMPRWRADRAWFAASGIRSVAAVRARPDDGPGRAAPAYRHHRPAPFRRRGGGRLRRLVQLRPSDLKAVKSMRFARPDPRRATRITIVAVIAVVVIAATAAVGKLWFFGDSHPTASYPFAPGVLQLRPGRQPHVDVVR